MNTIPQDRGRSVAAITLIGAGVFFLLAQVFDFSFFGAFWPLFVLLPGAAFLYFAFTGGKGAAGLAVPGAIITGTGLILTYQNFTGNWESWAYVWTLYPLFVGLALTFMSSRTGDENMSRTGRGLVRWGGVAFVIAAVLFELVIFNDGGVLGSLALPLVLIGIGVFMLFGNRARNKAKNDAPVFVGPRVVGVNGKPKNGYSSAVNGDLQRKIDAALAEEDDSPIV